MHSPKPPFLRNRPFVILLHDSEERVRRAAKNEVKLRPPLCLPLKHSIEVLGDVLGRVLWKVLVFLFLC